MIWFLFLAASVAFLMMVFSVATTIAAYVFAFILIGAVGWGVFRLATGDRP